ncbi:hypothetical protein SUDANB120_00061 [Streptomyces sp. enrichment culture]
MAERARVHVIMEFSTLSDHEGQPCPRCHLVCSHPSGRVLALVHGSGYERLSSPGCSDRTIRRRLKEWAVRGISEAVHTIALQAYDRMIGRELSEMSVDGCITKAPCGGEGAGRSPVDAGSRA